MGPIWAIQKDLPRYRAWKKVGFILIFLHVVWFPVTWAAEEPTPEFLIRQVIKTYRSLETYRVIGHTDTEITDFSHGGKVFRTTHSFSILLRKPNGYHIILGRTIPMQRRWHGRRRYGTQEPRHIFIIKLQMGIWKFLRILAI